MANVSQRRMIEMRGWPLQDRETMDAKLFMDLMKDHSSPTAKLMNAWEKVPFLLLSDEDWDHGPLFVIGQSDYMMWPALPPGSVLRLDTSVRKITEGRFLEFDRPIYLIEYNNQFYCCFVQRERDVLILLPYPESPCRPQRIPFRGSHIRGQLSLFFRPLASRNRPFHRK